MAKTLAVVARRRYNTNNKEAALRGFPPIPYEEYFKLLKRASDDGFICPYCKELMVIDDIKPYYHVPSIDHRIPLDIGGQHNVSNMIVVCHRCNIIKGTMTEVTYRELMKLLESHSHLKNMMFIEMWQGKFANKIGREKQNKFQCSKCGWINDVQ